MERKTVKSARISTSGDASITRRQLITGAAAAAAFHQVGCASPVPGGNGLSALSGITLQVQLMFAAPQVNPSYYYYFLINNSNSSVATYPVPVGTPSPGTTYGNGFATANDGSSGGFTDFVLYSNYQYNGAQPNQGYALYHVANTYPQQGVNNPGNFVANGSPFQVFSPQSSGGSPNVIAFNLDLAQLFEYPNSTNSQGAAKNLASNLRWIQVNMIATNIVPVDITTPQPKFFDSFGDDSNGVGTDLQMDLKDGPGTYAANTPGSPVEVPGDVWVALGGGVTNQYPALDLVNWTIVIENSQQ
jgi:hypothetical protein